MTKGPINYFLECTLRSLLIASFPVWRFAHVGETADTLQTTLRRKATNTVKADVSQVFSIYSITSSSSAVFIYSFK